MALLPWMCLIPSRGHAAALLVQTALKASACHAMAADDAEAVTPAVALGLLAFNTPYLFGGRAARTGLTCGACHGGQGPSGAAAHLVFTQPVPDLARAASQGVDVAAFAGHAVPQEFDGPRPDAAMLAGLAALARVLAPRGEARDPACLVTPDRLIGLDLRLILREVATADADRLDFLIDSTRFVLGTMAAGQQSPAMQAMILQTNRALRAAEDAVDAGQRSQAAQGLRGALSLWDARMAAHRNQTFILTAERGTGP